MTINDLARRIVRALEGRDGEDAHTIAARAMDIANTGNEYLYAATTLARVEFVAEVLRQAIAEEREACIAIVRHYLQFDSQRAVSWHEVQDAIEAIRARGDTTKETP